MNSPRSLLRPESSSLYVLDLPRLRVGELEQAVLFKVQALSPIPLVRLKTWFHSKQTAQGWRVWVFLSMGEELPDSAGSVACAVPLGLANKLGTLVVMARLVGPNLILAEYQKGDLVRLSRPIASVHSLWEWVGKDEFVGLSLAEGSQDLWPFDLPEVFKPISLPELRRKCVDAPLSPRIRSIQKPWGPLVVAILGLALLLAGGMRWLDSKHQAVAVWKSWATSTPRETDANLTLARWKALSVAAGVPLPGLLERLAGRWPTGVLVKSFAARGLHLVIGAEAASGLGSFQALSADPWFRDLKLSTLKPLPGSREEFWVEGEVNLEP